MPDPAITATVYLGLGSNLGNRLVAMQSAVRALQQHSEICVDFDTGIGSLYETSPTGTPSPQPMFLNSVVSVSTTLSPFDLLKTTLSIEAALGRTRHKPGEARVIDIDLLFYDDRVIDDEVLSLPHPRAHLRRFVLEPLSEIAADFVHPTEQVTINTLVSLSRTQALDEIVNRVAGPNWPVNRQVDLTRNAQVT